ncbi:MAG: helix-turn-helix transcriptional regulator [Cyclobacteriaceae bacterium]|nr:helix-turn-helix transcriptional regulator [Cyclobacteriaceae bacterium HetDA_MAG_MS6]
MQLYIDIPDFPLRRAVKCLIYYEDYTADHAFEQLLPDGSTQLVIELDGNPRVLCGKNDTQTSRTFRDIWITGIQHQTVTYAGEEKASTLTIQFEPGGLFQFLGIPATEFQDNMIPADLLSVSELSSLREKLMDIQDPQTLLNRTKSLLTQKLDFNNREAELVHHLRRQLDLGNQTLKEIGNSTGFSNKHLIHQFKKLAGTTPKQYQKISRFNQALNLLNQKDTLSYCQVAYGSGYYDQAHLINNFQQLSGYTPSQYQKAIKSYPHVIASGLKR